MTMRDTLSAADVDALDVRWIIENDRVRREVVCDADPTRAQAILGAAIGVPTIEILEMFAEGVVVGGIRDWDGGGFDFSASRGSGSVVVWNAVDDEIEVPTQSFVDLMLRSVESALLCRPAGHAPVDLAWDLLDRHRALLCDRSNAQPD